MARIVFDLTHAGSDVQATVPFVHRIWHYTIPNFLGSIVYVVTIELKYIAHVGELTYFTQLP